MDAAMRLPSTPLGQVEIPSLNAFFSEYFLRPGKGKQTYWKLIQSGSGCFLFILTYRIAPFIPKKKLSLKLHSTTVSGWYFE
jgi:hypothetical protein